MYQTTVWLDSVERDMYFSEYANETGFSYEGHINMYSERREFKFATEKRDGKVLDGSFDPGFTSIAHQSAIITAVRNVQKTEVRYHD